MKKYIAPVVITLIVLAVLASYALGIRYIIFSAIGTGIIAAVLIMLAITGLAAALIVTLVRRIKEIRKDEKDDFSEY